MSTKHALPNNKGAHVIITVTMHIFKYMLVYLLNVLFNAHGASATLYPDTCQ